MNLDQSPELETFRLKIRAFFANEFPKDIIEKNKRGASLTTADIKKSEQALASKGWLVPGMAGRTWRDGLDDRRAVRLRRRAGNARACPLSRPWAQSMWGP